MVLYTIAPLALFSSKAKTFRIRPWLYVLLFATAANYLWRATLLIANGGSAPVELIHGNQSASVVGGVSILDVVKSCPSLYGESARFDYPWWLPLYVTPRAWVISVSELY